ncbi:MAG: hypothetical protein AAGC74_09395 [Verrucomicrobiota bacterium]
MFSNNHTAIALSLLFTILPLKAQTTPSPLTDEAAIELLALRDQRLKRDYQVAFKLDGEIECHGITTRHATQVNFFGPVIENGDKRRQLLTANFLWNTKYGWFLYKIGELRNRTHVFIWSEKLGEIEID